MIISNDADLQNCIFFQTEVEVWIEGEIDTTTKVLGYTDSAVRVIDGMYLRNNIVLKVVYN